MLLVVKMEHSELPNGVEELRTVWVDSMDHPVSNTQVNAFRVISPKSRPLPVASSASNKSSSSSLSSSNLYSGGQVKITLELVQKPRVIGSERCVVDARVVGNLTFHLQAKSITKRHHMLKKDEVEDFTQSCDSKDIKFTVKDTQDSKQKLRPLLTAETSFQLPSDLQSGGFGVGELQLEVDVMLQDSSAQRVQFRHTMPLKVQLYLNIRQEGVVEDIVQIKKRAQKVWDDLPPWAQEVIKQTGSLVLALL